MWHAYIMNIHYCEFEESLRAQKGKPSYETQAHPWEGQMLLLRVRLETRLMWETLMVQFRKAYCLHFFRCQIDSMHFLLENSIFFIWNLYNIKKWELQKSWHIKTLPKRLPKRWQNSSMASSSIKAKTLGWPHSPMKMPAWENTTMPAEFTVCSSQYQEIGPWPPFGAFTKKDL